MYLKQLSLALAAVGALLLSSTPAAAQNLARGKYLTEEIGKCQECHTPRLDDNSLDKSKWLKGGPMNIAPIKPVEGWHKSAPDLTSSSRLWERWGDAGMTKFLTTGLNPRGNKADAPMPEYHLTPEDAAAIVAYLKSLK